MVNPSEHYRAAAGELAQLAVALEGGDTDTSTALGTTDPPRRVRRLCYVSASSV